ncbi:RNA polymerase subunit sigma-70 [Serinibacter arcticus]|uniref:RNA polymerase subunit sigma-70 n=1 Tax=Serinibacter arcticus TaxID=1655435 RepID=A0A2U1ZV07_9MICO|nr:RNA polymerase subunit sigma-70 [Serinibacter arcticus]PWD50825.1 RNA polymerase subunit sigma-70 [Serinibacter arcticus]
MAVQADPTTVPTALSDDVLDQAERLRGELRGFAYRMLASVSDADDAVQNALVRAWKAADKFDGRSSVRTWMYRIVTNVCLDEIAARKRRALPVDLESEASPPVASSLGQPLPASSFVEPVLDAMIADPADVVVSRESVRLAFVAALQNLPASQRAVLILRDVLAWRAAEVAELLEISVAAANSQLQRARETMKSVQDGSKAARPNAERAVEEAVVARYVAAFERYDMEALATMLAEDAVMSMPPFSLYLAGRDDVVAWMAGPGHECLGSRLIPVEVNGGPGFAQYRKDPAGGHFPWGVHALVVRDDVVVEETVFLGADVFATLGLPAHLD